MKSTAIYWLRNDLRLHDNETLTRAIEENEQVLPVFIFDPRNFQMLQIYEGVEMRKSGINRYHFLKESLEDLRKSLKEIGGNLLIKFGKPEEVLPELAQEFGANKIYAQKEIASEETTVEQKVAESLRTINTKSLNCELELVWGKTLYHLDDIPYEPHEIPLVSKTFRIKVSKETEIRATFPTPNKIETPNLGNWGEIPTPKELDFKAEEITENQKIYQGGETAGLERLQYYTFESELLKNYKWTRNRSLGMDYSSKFSPWMALGCLSPRKIHETVKLFEAEVKRNKGTWWLIFEVVWRDLFKFQTLRFGNLIFAEGGIKKRETNWKYDVELFDRWRFGNTGIPFIDAHIRELNETGFMSNRGRVNCASFLTRDYEIDWRWGASWFETQLLDYDVCSNWLNWNTQATEIYYTNPIHQSLKYDQLGEYVLNWLPELSKLPQPIYHAPWLAKELEIEPASNYPEPAFLQKKWNRSIQNLRKVYLGEEVKIGKRGKVVKKI